MKMDIHNGKRWRIEYLLFIRQTHSRWIRRPSCQYMILPKHKRKKNTLTPGKNQSEAKLAGGMLVIG
jgi:hypothetical protein